MTRRIFVNSGTFSALDRLVLWMNGFVHQEGVLGIVDWRIIYDRPSGDEPLHHRAILLLDVTDAFAGDYITSKQAELEIAA